MMFLKSLLLIVLASLTGTTSAEEIPFFHYDGDMREFNEVHAEHKGTIKYHNGEVYTAPELYVPSSDRSLEFTQMFDSSYSGRYHSEISLYNAYTPGKKGYYAFAFKLPQDWQFTPDTMTLLQFIGDFNGWEEKGLQGKSWSPSTKVWIKGNQLFTRIREGSVLKEDCEWLYLSDVSKNVWHTVVLGVDWQDTKIGSFKAWYDGELMVHKTHVATTMKADNRPYTLRVGLYATDWHNHDNVRLGHQSKKTIYIDKIAMGNSYDEVAPEIWSCCDKCHECQRKVKKMVQAIKDREDKEEEKERD